ncbi:hypothetical protein C7N43_38925 [Sphingobacteriales bacterium UPWRP_1]|nr:hypothetical protein B6N25_11660 [Sphingobacteriales bacterium TSM_CSS]PSJ71514.1 hypothetical protein C7N43_38925 [Sphingobacteriales bacterium UPWRP_1]
MFFCRNYRHICLFAVYNKGNRTRKKPCLTYFTLFGRHCYKLTRRQQRGCLPSGGILQIFTPLMHRFYIYGA